MATAALFNTLALLLLAITTLTALQLAESHNDHLLDVAAGVSLSGVPSAPQIDCGEACQVRCRLSSRPNLCHRACGTCCDRCHCVPPGTYGNYNACPCYASLTTHGGQRKCP